MTRKIVVKIGFEDFPQKILTTNGNEFIRVLCMIPTLPNPNRVPIVWVWIVDKHPGWTSGNLLPGEVVVSELFCRSPSATTRPAITLEPTLERNQKEKEPHQERNQRLGLGLGRNHKILCRNSVVLHERSVVGRVHYPA
jgi:hypothetical protein